MHYKRPIQRTEGLKPFELGTHAATITKVTNKKSQKGNSMFIFSIEGKNKEKGMYFLVFDTDYTQESLNFILASIEDNGVEVPEINFGYNKQTLQFLENKDVYINVEEKEYKGKLTPAVTQFLTLEEFENSEESSEEIDDSGW